MVEEKFKQYKAMYGNEFLITVVNRNMVGMIEKVMGCSVNLPGQQLLVETLNREMMDLVNKILDGKLNVEEMGYLIRLVDKENGV